MAKKSVARQASSKSRAQGIAAIPAEDREKVRAILDTYANDPNVPKTPALVYKWLLELREGGKRRAEKEGQKAKAETQRSEREQVRKSAIKAIQTLAMVRDGMRALEDDADLQPYMDDYDLALYLRLAIMDAGKTLENALMVHELMPWQKEGNRHFNAGDE